MGEVGKTTTTVIPQDLGVPKSKTKGKMDGDVSVKIDARSDTSLSGSKVSLKSGPGKLARLGHSIKDAFQRLTHSGKYNSEKVFMSTTPYVKALKTTMSNGLLETSPKLMDRMDNYRKTIGSNLSKEQMKDLINTGERLVSALKHGKINKDGSINVTVGDKTHKVPSSTYTTLAISWYMMAKAGNEGDDHLVQRGAMILKDDDNKLFNFLSKAPTAYGRVSTHFGERGTATWKDALKVGIMGPVYALMGKKAQTGIEDFQNRFPGQRGCMVFDKLEGHNGQKELYLKFESGGMPSMFRLSSSHGDTYDSGLKKAGNFFRSFGRILGHAKSFIGSRSFVKKIKDKLGMGGSDKAEWRHRENINKDAPKKTIYDPFKSLLSKIDVSGSGLDKSDVEMFGKRGKKFGLDFIEAFTQGIPDKGPLPPGVKLKDGVTEKQFLADLSTLRAEIREFRSIQGDDQGVQRKGSEVHVTIDDVPKQDANNDLFDVPLD